jgi:hypothetical protein
MDHLKELSIQKWINDNFCTFTDAEICSKFNKTIPELWAIYKGNFPKELPKFSYFKAPVRNTIPAKGITLPQLHQAITGNYYKKVTETYRAMPTGTEKAAFKTSRFDHVTFAGTFAARKSDSLKNLSGYTILDFDHVKELEPLKRKLLSDPVLDAEMVFTSPSGDGLKVVIFNNDKAPYQSFYDALIKYIQKQYPDQRESLDVKNKDVARTCFVCHDETAFIKPQYLELWPASKN